MKKTFEISIPTDWSEVSIEKYSEYNKMLSEEDTDKDVMVKTICALCGVPEQVVEVMKLSDLKQINQGLQKLISKPVNKEIINKIDIEGTMYGFHPNLDEMTMGEFVDIETFAKDNDLSKMMSVLYRPISEEEGSRYNIEPYDSDIHVDNWHKFKKLSVNIGNPIAVFFWTLGTTQLNNFHQSSEKEESNLHQVDMAGLQ